MKILALTDEFFHEDRQTDMTKLTVAFRNFTNSPEKERRHRLTKEVCLL